jgi:CDP-2,3-bis-(O-geranylgeranyl)-sn-glycerol synthase
VLVGVAAMAGDLFSSFTKRRLGLAPSSMALGLDQIPESLFPLLACRLLLPLSFFDVVAGVTLFFIGGLILSRILFRFNLRDRPY